MIRLLQALLLLTLLATSAVAQGRRIALVVGIDAYAHLPPLQKAVADARAVAAVLKDDLAFTTVISGENLTREALLDKLGDLDAAIQPGDLVFLFFAGHGVAFGSNNYLLPADLRLPASSQAAQANRVIDNALAVDALIRRIQAQGAKTTFLVLDACRDNPFGERGLRNIGNERGLARIEAPQGVFVLYSAGYGQKALDRLPGADAVKTSVFTRHLIPALKTPGLSHVAIAKRVQEEVDKMARDSAGHAQQPAYYDQIIGSVVFRDLVVVPQPVSPRPTQQAPPPPLPTRPTDTSALAAREWVRLEASMDRAELEAFRRQFGAGNPLYDQRAAARIAVLVDIEKRDADRRAAEKRNSTENAAAKKRAAEEQAARVAKDEADRIAAEKRTAEEQAARIATAANSGKRLAAPVGSNDTVSKLPEKTQVLSTAAKSRLLGKRRLSVQWISWDYFGTLDVTEANGLIKVRGEQKSRENSDYLRVEGVVTKIDEKTFDFVGVVTQKIHHLLDGEPCVIEGRMQFAIEGTRRYWRLQPPHQGACDAASYVDVFF